MSVTPLFSVVIPAYNRAHSIRQAIDSVLKQTEQRFEIIVVDDGSTDNTDAVLDEIKKVEPRLHYIKQQNGGATNARNTGIKAAKGSYIAFLDSDDVFLPEHLAQALPVLESGNSRCTFTQVQVDRGNEVSFLKPSRGPKESEVFSEYLLCNKGFVQTSTLIVPSELAKSVMYDELIGYGDDMDFAIRLVAAGAKITMLEKPGAIWQDHWSDSRLSSVIDPVKRIAWLDRTKPLLTKRAYYAVLGRSVAKGYAQQGKKFKGLSCYFKSLFNGGFTPKTAVMYFFQVSLNQKQYRKFSDFLAKLGFRP